MTGSPLRLRSPAARFDRVVMTPAARAVGRAAAGLAGLLLPADCAACGNQDGPLCADCGRRLAAALRRPYRADPDAAALPLLFGAAPGPDAGPAPLPVVAAGRYGGEVATVILAFKDHGRTALSRRLRPAVHRALAAAPALVDGLGADPSGPVLLVPVPGSAAGFRRRGYDPVAELVGGTPPAGWELAPGLLRHARRGLRSTNGPRGSSGPWGGSAPCGRGAEWGRILRPGRDSSHAGTVSRLRRERSAGRFRAPAGAARFRGRTVVLFDDVMTTGATLAAAWRALDEAGLTPAAAVVLAAVTAPGARPETGLTTGWGTY